MKTGMVIGCIVALLRFSPCFGQGYGEVTLGMVAPRDGVASREAVDLAIDDAGSRGELEIDGRTRRINVRVVGGQPEGAAREYCRQVSGVIGIGDGPHAADAAKIYQECKLPHISYAATTTLMTHQGHPTAFRISANQASIVAGLILAARQRDVRRLAVVAGGAATIATQVRALAVQRGIEIVEVPAMQDDGRNASDVVSAMRNAFARPDAIFFAGTATQGLALLRELDTSSFGRVKILAGGSLCDERALGPRAADILCTTGTVAIGQMPGGQAWRRRFVQKFGKQPTPSDAAAYDAATAIIQAMRKDRSTTDYLRALKATDFVGVSGRIAFNANGDLRQPTFSLYTYFGPDRADAPGPTCPSPCPTPSGSGTAPNAEDTPAIPPGCCGTPGKSQ